MFSCENKISLDSDEIIGEKNKNPLFTKDDEDLYDESSHVVHSLINIRRVRLPNNGESWEILKDNKIMFSLNGKQFTKKERRFLHTLEGMKFLMSQFKAGNKSISKIKKNIKRKL